MIFIIRSCTFNISKVSAKFITAKIIYLLVFAKMNYRESVSTPVLVSIVSAEHLFKIFLNNFLFKKKDHKLKTTLLKFRAFIIPENSFGCDVFIHSRKFIHAKKTLKMTSVKVNSR